MNKKSNPDFRFGEFNIPEAEEMAEMSEKVKDILDNSSGIQKKQKITHSISELSQVLIKDFAEECSVTQGSIVEIAPLLFKMILEISIEKREKSLDAFHILKNQINSSLSGILELFPHLEPYIEFIKKGVEETYEIEKVAVDLKSYKGVDSSGCEVLSKVKLTKGEPAYYKEVRETLKSNTVLSKLFETLKEKVV